jgi:plastocyanin
LAHDGLASRDRPLNVAVGISVATEKTRRRMLDSGAKQSILAGVVPSMPNGVRNSIWALFFLAGMVFMAALVFMARPELFSNLKLREKPGITRILATRDGPDNEVEPIEPAPPLHPEKATSVHKPLMPVARVEARVVKPPSPAAEPANSIVEATVPSLSATALPPRNAVTSEIIGVRRPGRSVFGQVKLVGELPPPRAMPSADGFCGPRSGATTVVSRVYLRASDNSLADVLVVLTGERLAKRHWPAPATKPVIVNRGCQFEPYVTAIQMRQSVTFENLDRVLHNVHLRPTVAGNPDMNVAMMPKARPIVARFNAAESFIRVECNVHPYMVAYVCVVDHPFFALTKGDGRFQIPNIPAGEYTLVAAHRRAGVMEKKIKVTDEESAEVEFVFEARPEIAQTENSSR